MNTIQSIAAKINAFAAQFKITKEAVEVTSYEQMGPNVRVFYKLDRTIGKTPEQIKKLAQKYRQLDLLIPDPFADGEDDGEEGGGGGETTTKPVTAFTVDLPSTIKVDDNVTIAPVFTPTNATDKTFTVTANPTGFVSILNGGALITGLKAGSTTLTIKANGGQIADVVKVINIEAKTPEVIVPTGVTADIPNEIIIGESFTPTVTITPADATDKTYKLNTSDASVIAVEGDKYTAKKAGTANLSVSANGATGVKTAVVTVTAKASD